MTAKKRAVGMFILMFAFVIAVFAAPAGAQTVGGTTVGGGGAVVGGTTVGTGIGVPVVHRPICGWRIVWEPVWRHRCW